MERWLSTWEQERRRYEVTGVVRHTMGIWMGALAGLISVACTPSAPPEGMQPVAADYADIPLTAGCAPGSRPDAAGSTDKLKSAAGIMYSIRTPLNYDATRAHPLLMVYPMAGASAERNEAFTRLTTEATRHGFIVVYTGHRPLSPEAVVQQAKVPQEIAARWCVDTRAVFATGHSDGGTVSHAMALLPETRGVFAGIAPSAAGFEQKDFAAYTCPQPLPVMVMHNVDDTLFPGWGRPAAEWWAACNRCDMSRPLLKQNNGCVVWQECAAGAPTSYCEEGGTHLRWQGRSSDIIRLFEGSRQH